MQSRPFRSCAHYDDDPADLYLYDIGSCTGRALAEAQNRPLVPLAPTYVGREGYQEEIGDQLMSLPGADAYRKKFSSWPAGAGKVLLISLGSACTHRPEFYRECLAAFGGLAGRHVVLQIGRRADAGELGDIPSNVEVHNWVPRLAILEQAGAFLTTPAWAGAAKGSTPAYR